MQIHQLRYQSKNKKRIGRGGKRGTYSGRGIKGQGARAGGNFRPHILDLIKQTPKLRGRGKNSFKSLSETRKLRPVAVNLAVIEKNFSAGDIVSPKTLHEKRLISKISGKLPKVKILGKGELAKKLKFKNCFFSESAKEKTK